MNTKTFFDARNTLDVLDFLLRAGHEKIPHGAKSKMAKAMGCHPSFLALVLNRQASLGQEHALGIAEANSLSVDQTDYFLTLLEMDRAGTPALRKYYQAKREQILRKQGALGSKLDSDRLLVADQESEFFTDWQLQAVLAATQIFEKSSPAMIAARLRIPENEAARCLMRLAEFRLVAAEGGHWRCLQSFVHFHGENAAIRRQYHLAWRIKAMETNFVTAPKRDGGTFNFSSLITVDDEARLEIAEILRAAAQRIAKRTKAAEAKDLTVLNIDFFSLLAGAESAPSR